MYKNWNLQSLFSISDNFLELQSYLEDLDYKYDTFSEQLDNLNQIQIKETQLIDLLTKEQNLFLQLGTANSYLECCEFMDIVENKIESLKNFSSKIYLKKVETSLFIDYLINNLNIRLIDKDNIQYYKKRKNGINTKEISSPYKINLLNIFFSAEIKSWEEMYLKLFMHTNKEINQLKHDLKNFDFSNRVSIFRKNEDLFANILNNFARHRLNIYKNFNKKNILEESLVTFNKMEESTLWCMLNVLNNNIINLQKYIKFKQRFLNLNALNWEELYLPLSSTSNHLDKEETLKLIQETIQEFDYDFYSFLENYIKNDYIILENNPSKKQTAITINFAYKNQSRIYINSPNEELILNLAHELGHAYHFHKINQMPILSRDYSLAISEAVAMFIELLVSEKLINIANDKNTRIYHLSKKIQGNGFFLLDSYSKFLFEYEIYQIRKNKNLNAEHLNALMKNIHKNIFGIEGNPLLWCSNPHFYKSSVPFYNYPYIFGCIVSNFFLHEYRKNKKLFMQRLNELLIKSGTENIENIFFEIFDIKLNSEELWEIGLQLVQDDIEYLISLN
ncbi:hypothetical protein [Lysinibacillus xylanilyticus]|uniref:hypothetical protein n=1 Tax=Lysinibacillus xylanilyticus TaxID=582475 RepID=UPI003D079AF4